MPSLQPACQGGYKTHQKHTVVTSEALNEIIKSTQSRMHAVTEINTLMILG